MLEQTGNPDVIFLHCLPSFHDFETDMAREAERAGIRYKRSDRRSIQIADIQKYSMKRKTGCIR